MVKQKTIFKISYWDGNKRKYEIFEKEPVIGYLNSILQKYNEVIITKEIKNESKKEI